MVLISWVWRVTSLDEIHVNVQCTVILHILDIKHKFFKVNCHSSHWLLENARSSQNWIGPIQYFSAEWDRRFSTDPVLTIW